MNKLDYTYDEITDALDELWEAESQKRPIQDSYVEIITDFNDFLGENHAELTEAGFPFDAIKDALNAGLDSHEQEKPINEFNVDCSGLIEAIEYDKFDIFK